MRPEHINWSRSLFASIRDGGVWGVPRSGLLFQRRGERLVLVNRMPWEDGMEISAHALVEYQEADYDLIRRHMEAAGIPCSSEVEE